MPIPMFIQINSQLIRSEAGNENAESDNGKTINIKVSHHSLIANPPYRFVLTLPDEMNPSDLKIGATVEATTTFVEVTDPEWVNAENLGKVHKIVHVVRLADRRPTTTLSAEFLAAPRSDRAGGLRSERSGRPIMLEKGADKTLRVPSVIIDYADQLNGSRSLGIRWMLEVVPTSTPDDLQALMAATDEPSETDKRVIMEDPVRTTVYLEESHIATLNAWGQGNISRGMRMIYAYIQSHPESIEALQERSAQYRKSESQSSDDISQAYMDAFRAAYGDEADDYLVRYISGWYQIVRVVNGYEILGSFRRAQIQNMTERLLARSARI